MNLGNQSFKQCQNDKMLLKTETRKKCPLWCPFELISTNNANFPLQDPPGLNQLCWLVGKSNGHHHVCCSLTRSADLKLSAQNKYYIAIEIGSI